MSQIVKAAVGLGSNLGDRLAHLREARARIAALPGVLTVRSSPLYETDPVDVPADYSEMLFLNAVLMVETEIGIEEWSRLLHAVEDDLFRRRTGERNAPRTIDIDLLTYGQVQITRPDLTLPHPQCTRRRFVCQPLADLEPALRLPGEKQTIREILASLPVSPVVRLVATDW